MNVPGETPKSEPPAESQPASSGPKPAETTKPELDPAARGAVARNRRRLSLHECKETDLEAHEEPPRGEAVVTAAFSDAQLDEYLKAEEPSARRSRGISILGHPEPGEAAGLNLSIVGAVASHLHQHYENKEMKVRGGSMGSALSLLSQAGLGFACRKGLKPESPNQDDFFIFRGLRWSLHGVFDGHGPCGHDVSYCVQYQLPRLMYRHPQFGTDPKAAMRSAFARTQDYLVHNRMPLRLDPSMSGTTATVVLYIYDQNRLIVGHVGDSRAVMARRTAAQSYQAIDLTKDHKPDDPEERRRIINSGGEILQLEGDVPLRVFIAGRLYPGLAMTRTLGDLVGAAAGIIAEPTLLDYAIDPADAFFLVCSDGVWEFITSQEAVNIVGRYPREQVQEGVEVLAQEAWNRWVRDEADVVDDITVQAIWLGKQPCPIAGS